jgi:hypothetical protein
VKQNKLRPTDAALRRIAARVRREQIADVAAEMISSYKDLARPHLVKSDVISQLPFVLEMCALIPPPGANTNVDKVLASLLAAAVLLQQAFRREQSELLHAALRWLGRAEGELDMAIEQRATAQRRRRGIGRTGLVRTALAKNPALGTAELARTYSLDQGTVRRIKREKQDSA